MSADTATGYDPTALAIVLIGTAIATLARCGLVEFSRAIVAARDLSFPGFHTARMKSSLAQIARRVRKRGPLCVDEPLPSDPILAETIDAYLRTGSLENLWEAAAEMQGRRSEAATRASAVFVQAAEAAPVFGLVGTLYAITQLSFASGGNPAVLAMGSAGTAALSTLYGVLLAHLVLIPLGHAIGRRESRDANARAELLHWFEQQVETTGERIGQAA